MKKRPLSLIFIANVFVGLIASFPLLNAQSDHGSLTGTVTDASKLVMSGVSVTVTNSATGIKATASTNEGGSYTILYLAAGTYKLTAKRAGFKQYSREGVNVEVGQATRLDFSLEVGEITATVEVTGQTTTLNSASSELGTVLAKQQFQELPLTGQGELRNPTFFMILVPGVTGRGTATVTMDQFNMRMLSTTVSGSPSGSTDFHLEGSIIGSGAEFQGDRT